MKWEKVKLGELYEVHNGLSKAGKFFGEGYPFLTFSTVFNNYFIPKQITDLVQSTEKEQESYSIRRGDVFVTRTSETSDELAMRCVALKDYPMATYNGFTKRMRPITNRVLPEYIGYYMRLPNFRGEFRAFSTMTTRASLRNEDLLGLEVKLPSIEIQKQIADILSAYDDLIENNQKQIKLLEEATQRLYKEWFVDLRFPGHENTKIVDGVPEGWSRTNINEILTFHRGYDLTKNEMKAGRYPVVGSTTVIGYHNEFKIKGPGIVTGRSGSLGKYQFIWDNFWPHNTSLYISDYKDHNIFFVYSLLQTVVFASLYNGGAIPTLNRNVLSNIEVIEPTDELQEMFAKIAEAQYRKIRNLEKQNNQLKMARDVLLPKLMSGEVEV